VTAPRTAPLALSLLAAATASLAQPPQAEPVYSAITVTARLGAKQDASSSAEFVTVRDSANLAERPLLTVGNVLESSPGVLVQQSSSAQVSPFLRGLTGYHVLNLIDGVRFNNSTFRSGPNQYLAFVEPSQASQVEATLGPSGTLYGSDALGGTIQVLTPSVSHSDPPEFHGSLSAFAATADRSAGSTAQLSFLSPRLSFLGGGSIRRHNDIRAGHATDSRHALRRFFLLPPSLIEDIAGPHLQNTAFTQDAAHSKLLLRPAARHSLSAWYQFSEQHGGNAYKDLWGGLGRMLSTFTPQRLHFGYARYELLAPAFLSRLSGAVSINHQTDGSARQGLNSSSPVTSDVNSVRALGFFLQAAREFSPLSTLTFGADSYSENVRSSRLVAGQPARPLYPDRSHYRTAGLYAQHAQELLRRRLRAVAGLRFNSVDSYNDLSFHAALTFRLKPWLELHALGGRGFRAPNLNDRGALGLNDLGFEIPASDARNAILGDSAGEAARPTSRSVQPLASESLWNAEAGFAVNARRLHLRVHAFDAELLHPIVRRTLLYPIASLPASLAGIPVTPNSPSLAQAAAAVTTVSTAFDPRAVKAFVNDGQSRYYGIDSFLRYQMHSQLRLDSGYSYLVGRDLYPNRNIRRLPPQLGFASLRYTPTGRRPWLELRADAAGAQSRLSGGDLDDERIGASRSRNDIRDFFNGSRISPHLRDGIFLPTGETLAQIQSRVLPGVASNTTRVPLYSKTAGWLSLAVRAGFPLTEQITISAALENLSDRNFRFHGSGIDAPGRSLWLRLDYSF
jgi:outer membrane receptor protein involved in Fe transport